MSDITFANEPPERVNWSVAACAIGSLLLGFTPQKQLCLLAFLQKKNTDSIVRAWQKDWPQTTFLKAKKPESFSAKTVTPKPPSKNDWSVTEKQTERCHSREGGNLGARQNQVDLVKPLGPRLRGGDSLVYDRLGKHGLLNSFEQSQTPLLLVGTDFQHRVWAALLDIPEGETVTYGELAAHIGKPKAARAVGTALGANPIPYLIPCHRVVAAQGLGGYTGGLDLKRRILDSENA